MEKKVWFPYAKLCLKTTGEVALMKNILCQYVNI